MSAERSGWIPARRIRVAMALAVACAVAALVAGAWARAALVLLLPAAVLGWVAFVMLRVRHRLSPRGGGFERRIHELVVSRLPLSAGAAPRALDVGCGDASLVVALLARAPAAEVTGVDAWGARWDYAQAACEARLAALGLRAVFRRMDAARLGFPDDTFDLVISVMCFHEVAAPEGDARRGPLVALAEALRVLRPGGAFVLVDRFRDRAAYGDDADLAATLGATTALSREPLGELLDIPWPLTSRRALGPVDVLSGTKASAPLNAARDARAVVPP